MRGWDAERIAAVAGAQLLRGPARPARAAGPVSAGVDSRLISPGELFVGLAGERADGGAYAVQALAAGAWGVLVSFEHARTAARAGAGGAVLAHEDPLAALQALAREWRRELGAAGAKVVAITGSTGKTSTKDILAALLSASMRTAASAANLNTEIGLPLAILAAARDSEALVLEMAMRGAGQIAELTAIAEPEIGVIVNVGPAHLELLGSLEAIAAAKAELIAGLPAGGSIVLPTDEPLLEPHRRADLGTVTFGDAGDVSLVEHRADGRTLIRHGSTDIELWPSFGQAHNLENLLAAVAAARTLGVTPAGRLDVSFSAMRGERLTLAGGIVLIDDCYNANPMSMCAAIDDLAQTAQARRVAVLGDMLELGPQSPRLHRDLGEHAAARGIELLVTVGPLAAEISSGFGREGHAVADTAAAVGLLEGLLRKGDTVLVKGSRGVGLERVVAALRAGGKGAGNDSRGGDRTGPQHTDAGSLLAPRAGSGRG